MSVVAETSAGETRILDLFSLRDEVAVVTGASSGIGQAAAEILAAAGARVAVFGRDAERTEAVAAGIRAAGGVAIAHRVDVTYAEELGEAFDRVTIELGAPNIVVANAGIGIGRGYRFEEGRFENFSGDIWDRVLATNLTGVFRTLQEAARRMPDGGRMIVTSSTAGLRADPMVDYAYVATKAAVANLARQAALEFAPRGIRVNVIAPGPFRTGIGGGAPITEEKERRWAALVPLGRMGDIIDDMQGPMLFLASPASRFVTGTVLAVDGGALALSHTGF